MTREGGDAWANARSCGTRGDAAVMIVRWTIQCLVAAATVLVFAGMVLGYRAAVLSNKAGGEGGNR